MPYVHGLLMTCLSGLSKFFQISRLRRHSPFFFFFLFLTYNCKIDLELTFGVRQGIVLFQIAH